MYFKYHFFFKNYKKITALKLFSYSLKYIRLFTITSLLYKKERKKIPFEEKWKEKNPLILSLSILIRLSLYPGF